MRIIEYDGRKSYLGVRFLRTIACSECDRGASLIIEEDDDGVGIRSTINEQFLIGVIFKMKDYYCTCEDRDIEESHPWVEEWTTERFK